MKQTTRITIEFDVIDEDVKEAHKNIYDLEECALTADVALSELLQDYLYDNGYGPMLEGEYRIVSIKDTTGEFMWWT